MKIWGNVPKVTEVYNRQKAVSKVSQTQGTAAKKDVVSISGAAKDFQTVLKAIKDVPDVRQDKVDELSEKYESGSYNVNGSDIAARVVGSLVDSRA